MGFFIVVLISIQAIFAISLGLHQCIRRIFFPPGSVNLVEHLFQFPLPFLLKKDDIVGAFPHPDLPIHSCAEDERSVAAHREAVYLRSMASQEEDLVKFIAVPETHRPVLRTGEEVARAPDEAQISDGILVAVHRPMGVAEVQAPDLDGLVGPAGSQYGIVGTRIEREDRELVPVQAQEELERIVEEDLDRGIEGGDEQQALLGVRRMGKSDTHDVVRHLQRPGMFHRWMTLRFFVIAPLSTAFDGPVLHELVRGSGDQRRGTLAAALTKVQRPDGAIVRLLLRANDISGCDVDHNQMALPRAEDHVRIPGQERGTEAVIRRPRLVRSTLRSLRGERAQAGPVCHVPNLHHAPRDGARQ
mmetsp:Transcript_30522/g.73678  ORF Transcript_30522/g.73678 Transcript_30522/m.73678 type:complete len:359 (-) Transcript_30522:339-1415(-)